MLNNFFLRVFGSRNQRLVKQFQKTVVVANGFAESLTKLSDTKLADKTIEFKARLAKGETLDQILPEAFAVVREAGQRVLGMRHFDVQYIGGMVLHSGRIAEMRTGEGKTLVATLPAYLNALEGKGVHVITVNDYLAARDAEWMGRLYRFLGLSVGVVVSGQSQAEKRAAYAADITYGTNNEFGFDYLRDNMAFSADEKVQRGLHYAIIDEVDSILIDEARTPLIISGPTDDSTDLYIKINQIIPKLTRTSGEEANDGDFWIDEKARQVHLSEQGHESIEKLFIENNLLAEGASLYESGSLVLMHHLNAALKAHHLYLRDVQYMLKDRQVVIVDEFTGRPMPGRRWSEGLHQAIEAKERLPIQKENQTLATITFQNLFRLYGKLSGMTGTADTEAFELNQTYGLEVVVIPTHRNMLRKDLPDMVFMTEAEKYEAIVNDIEVVRQAGRPILVGTGSIASSEVVAALLSQKNIPHQVLNAKQHQREADIIAQAGRAGSVTIATNMAGRGTDILLGGNWEAEADQLNITDEAGRAALKAEWKKSNEAVIQAGGLHVIGSERHESRRIDNQLRGRGGRQGDPGTTRFYLALDDTLMRIFTPPTMRKWFERAGLQKGEAIEHRMVTNAIEKAQRKVEAHNFDIRKNVLEYDNVANDQRKVIYEDRNRLMASGDVSETFLEMRERVLKTLVSAHMPAGAMEEQWDVAGLTETLWKDFSLDCPIAQWLKADQSLQLAGIEQRILNLAEKHYQAKESNVGDETLRHFEKAVMLDNLDRLWREHLAAMDYLRLGIGLRGYAQKDPKQEYKREAFQLFQRMLDRLDHDVVSVVMRAEIKTEADVQAVEARHQAAQSRPMQFAHDVAEGFNEPENTPSTEDNIPNLPVNNIKVEPSRDLPRVGRNDPCPCGSGKKYKACHGKLA